MDGDPLPISPIELYSRLGTASAPLVFDIRRAADVSSSDRLIVGASRHPADDVAQWSSGLPADPPLVVYCTDAQKLSPSVASALCAAGLGTAYLEGGLAAWTERGLPTRKNLPGSAKWVTREHPKIDRIACPWLIRRFIDPRAEFLYVPAKQVLAVAKETGATPYDIDGVEFTHEGERCSFDTILRIYDIRDPALDYLATIVRGADTSRHDLAAQCGGLFAISLGLSANFPADHEMLGHGMVIYDALFAWCRALQTETHNWPPPKPVQQVAL
jgi:rhodanese-related sulfurtransferase